MSSKTVKSTTPFSKASCEGEARPSYSNVTKTDRGVEKNDDEFPPLESRRLTLGAAEEGSKFASFKTANDDEELRSADSPSLSNSSPGGDHPSTIHVDLSTSRNVTIRSRDKPDEHALARKWAIMANNAVPSATKFPTRPDLASKQVAPKQPDCTDWEEDPALYRAAQVEAKDLVEPPTITIAGVTVKLADRPNCDPENYMQHRRYSLEARIRLSDHHPEHYEVFRNSAVSNPLGRHNRLQRFEVSTKDSSNPAGYGYHLRNLTKQMTTMREHAYAHCFDNEFTVVTPVDVTSTPALHETTYNLFEQSMLLHGTQVGQSTAWAKTWIACPELQKNPQIALDFVKACTEQSLLDDALSDFYEYLPIYHGGALLFFCVMQRIYKVSEATIKQLHGTVRNLDVTTIDGENIETAVSLIRSVYKFCTYSSTSKRNHVPEDFVLWVLKAFASTSCPQFNAIFEKIISDAQVTADAVGGTPNYGDLTQVCSLAMNSYKRMSTPGESMVWVSKPAKGAYSYQHPGGGPRPGPSHESKKSDNPCYNCGQIGCYPKICRQAIDPERIERAKAKAQAAKQKSSPPGGSRRRSGGDRDSRRSRPGKDPHGRPLKFNRNGDKVVDQKRWSALKAQAQAEAAKPALEAIQTSLDKLAKLSVQTDSPTTDSTPSDTGASAHFAAQISEIQEIARAAIGRS